MDSKKERDLAFLTSAFSLSSSQHEIKQSISAMQIPQKYPYKHIMKHHFSPNTVPYICSPLLFSEIAKTTLEITSNCKRPPDKFIS
jgi:hypothetical protein